MKSFLIYSEIGGMWGTSSAEVAEFLNQNKDQDVEFRINSPGGSVFEGIAIYNLMKAHKGSVSVVVDSLCASIATIIALGGDSIKMNLGSVFMIHNPWSMAFGEAEDFRKEADLLDSIKNQLISIYMTKFQGSEEELIQMLDAETWLSDSESIKFGFVDSIEREVQIAASIKFDLKKYFNTTPKGNNMKEQEEKLDSVETPEVETEAVESAEQEINSEAQAIEAEVETEEVQAEAVETEIEEEVEVQAEIQTPGIQAKADLDINAKIESEVQARIAAEMKRQKEIKALAFKGQEELVEQLIEEQTPLAEASLRIIENKKELELNAPVNSAASEGVAITAAEVLAEMSAAAPEVLNDGIDDSSDSDSLEGLRKAHAKATDPELKRQIMTKISLKKKQLAS